MISLRRKLVLILSDIVLIHIILLMSFVIVYGRAIPQIYRDQAVEISIVTTTICIGVFLFFNLYNSLWRFASIDELLNVVMAAIVATGLLTVYHHMMRCALPISIYYLFFTFIIMFIGGSRLSYRILRKVKHSFNYYTRKDYTRVMIIGAGEAGVMVIRELRKHLDLKLRPVAVIDDDKEKHNRRVLCTQIYGGRDKIAEVAKEQRIDEIIIAIPTASKLEIRAILDECKKTKCKLKTLPGMYDILNNKVSIQEIRDVQIEDLLGREQICVDLSQICDYVNDKVVLVTGGGGSIGSELCRQIAGFAPGKLLVLDIYENNAYDLQQELNRAYPNLEHETLIASVRDRQRLESIFSTYRPDVVFHAAAHKHVPLMEHNPSEAIKNNVFGTLNVAEYADKFGADKFVMISTDKAVNPTNIMGATKRIAEMIIQGLNRHSETEYVAVRFGNVLGSNGSVIPLFKKQIAAGGPVTVTHPEITRFFMTIPEAVELVLQAGSMAKGGEIFVLDMGQPVKIVDLARDLIRLSGLEPDVDIKIEYSGLRPGEKLYEELLMESEGLTATKHQKIFVGQLEYVDTSVLRKELEKLKFVMTGSSEDLIEYVKDMVPTYVSAQVAGEVAVGVDEHR